MSFRFGEASEAALVGVIPPLVHVARRALELTRQDFGVFEGLRTIERQRKLFASGASRTMNSLHLKGRALDLVPYVDGRLQWQAPLCDKVAIAMRQASIELDVPLVWGAVWDRLLSELDPKNIAREVRAYIVRWHAANPDEDREPLIDRPHFQDAA